VTSGDFDYYTWQPYPEDVARYGTYKDRGLPRPHLNGLQRWLGHILDRGDPEHLA